MELDAQIAGRKLTMPACEVNSLVESEDDATDWLDSSELNPLTTPSDSSTVEAENLEAQTRLPPERPEDHPSDLGDVEPDVAI